MAAPRPHSGANYVAEIIKRLERNTAYGHRPSAVFEHWLELVHASLAALPAHLRSAAETGRPAADPPETQALWARIRSRYPQPAAWTHFAEAFGLLLDATAGFWDDGPPPAGPGGFDVLGSVYMELAANPHSGQFFTPWAIAAMMAQMTIQDGAAEVHDRLRRARETAGARNDLNAHLLAAAVLAGLALPGDRPDLAHEHFVTRILPLIAADYEPLRICDPCCGSGILLLAAAQRFPAWQVQAGLVQLYGVDIDQTCVQMARCNCMLYGVPSSAWPGGGYRLTPALTAPPAELAALPEPFAAAYTLAQVAQAAGDTETVQAIAHDLRRQQTLFDPAEYAVPTRTATLPPAPRPAVRRAPLLEPVLNLTLTLDCKE